jgi:hypothetical protein
VSVGRKPTAEQYAAEPVPGRSSVRSTIAGRRFTLRCRRALGRSEDGSQWS